MRSKDKEIEALKRKRAVAKGKFTRNNPFTTAHSDDSPVTVIQGMHKVMKLTFKNVEDISDELMELLSAKEKDLAEEAD